MSDMLLGYSPVFKPSPDQYEFGSDNDIQFDTNGLLRLVEKTDKLKQSVGKILLTDQGSNTISSGYGSVLNGFIGASLSDQPVYALIKQTIIDALGYHVGLYEDSTINEEKINTLDSISFKVPDSTNVGDPTNVVIEIKITDPNSKYSTVRLTL